MAIFVDLDEESEPPQAHGYYHHSHGVLPEWNKGGKEDESSSVPTFEVLPNNGSSTSDADADPSQPHVAGTGTAGAGGLDLNKNAMTEALGYNPPDTSSLPLAALPLASENQLHARAKEAGLGGGVGEFWLGRMADTRQRRIAMAIASSLDLNSLDNLSRSCRRVREALLQYHSAVIAHTLHCENEDVAVDSEDTLRYRARAGNWFYMMDDGTGRGEYSGKSGSCARDMVAECRRCARVVCRNCAIKPPAPVVLRDRHRRLCLPCAKAPLGTLTRPRLRSDTPLDADVMQRAICTCTSDGVWLCQPCGRSIRSADHDYQSIWKWRSQYGDVIGGLGTGIGEGDRGVICGRGEACCASRERQQETDCEAEDARSVDLMLSSGSVGGGSGTATPPLPLPLTAASSSSISQATNTYATSFGSNASSGGGSGSSSSANSLYSRSPNSRSHTPEVGGTGTTAAGGGGSGAVAIYNTNNNGSANNSSSWLPQLRGSSPTDPLRYRSSTPLSLSLSTSPLSVSMQQRPGYARHEIEGIGGVVKTKLVRIVRVGACVPEWEDERHHSSQVLGREVSGRARSWCGWCWRVIPGKKDAEVSAAEKEKERDKEHERKRKRGGVGSDVAVSNDNVDGNGIGNDYGNAEVEEEDHHQQGKGKSKGKGREKEMEKVQGIGGGGGSSGPWGGFLPLR
ncbi:hypothetical protein SLS62_008374 [Diatrype stigma]|uniref:Uncharacterized protein n=1 Tax=Diatrype stigma TaxID=117547 RepID=A0AAN9YL33_9PEZI